MALEWTQLPNPFTGCFSIGARGKEQSYVLVRDRDDKHWTASKKEYTSTSMADKLGIFPTAEEAARHCEMIECPIPSSDTSSKEGGSIDGEDQSKAD